MTKEDKSFDLKIKSMLEQAEAPVPEGTWEAIRARIPARTTAPVRRVWWGVGAGLSAAAAVALALVLGGTFRTAPASMSEKNAIAQVMETPAVPQAPVTEEAEQPVVSAPAKAAPDGIQTASTRSMARKAPVAEAASIPVQGVAGPAQESEPVSVKEERESTAESAAPKAAERSADKPAAQPKETWRDPFARMAFEDAHRKTAPKTSFQIHGLVGTNDKAMTTLRSGMMAAPAKAKSESGQSAAITETGESKYAIPVSFGLGAKFYLSERWALGTGVSFSILNRTFPGTVASGGETVPGSHNLKHTVQYIGIPLNLYFDLVSSKFIKMYAFGGGSIEKGIGQKYTVQGGEKMNVWKMSVPGVQGSADLGLGIQMKLSDHMGLYLDPSAKYYFGANQPKTIRTQQPVMFNLEFGVRFDL